MTLHTIWHYLRFLSGKSWVCLASFIAALGCLMGLYFWYITGYLKDEAMDRFQDASNHTSIITTTLLLDKKKHLDKVANLVKYADGDVAQVAAQLGQSAGNANVFEGVGFVSADGQYSILSDPAQVMEHLPYMPKDQRFFMKGMNGKDYLSVLNGSLIFSEPVETSRGQGVLFALYNADDLKDVLSVNFFSGQGYSVIIDVEENKLLWSDNAPHLAYESGSVFLNYMAMKDPKQFNIKALCEAIAKKESGILTGCGFEPMYLYYRPLLGDLYILTIIPQLVIATSYQVVMRYMFLLFFILFIAIVGLAVYFIYNEWKRKRDLEELLYVDTLTGKASYKKFQLQADHWLERDDFPKAFIAFDIDNFKLFNLIYGYPKGNDLLRQVADILARYAGTKGIFAYKCSDLFVMMLTYNDVRDVIWTCQEIRNEVRLLGKWQYKKFRINMSIGIYLIPPHETDVLKMENYAIMARREAKKCYELGYRFYDEDLKNERLHLKQLVDDMSTALEKGEFYPWFQPKYDAKTQQIIGAEALIRWYKDDGTMVSPVQFIPIAEQTGIIREIDDYMFNAVCRQLQQWREADYPVVPVAINVSRYGLYRHNFIAEHMELLKQCHLPTELIQLEVTEGTLYSKSEVSEKIVNTLRSLGIQVLIDDFGTGYSSISMVKRFNATALKIDKSFVDDVSYTGKKMLKYIINIAKLMNMRTIAEGVETKEQYEFLRDQDCDVIQGFYFAKPMKADDFAALLRKEAKTEKG